MKNEKVLKLSENQLGEVTGGGKVGNFVGGNVCGFLLGPVGIAAGVVAVTRSDKVAEVANEFTKNTMNITRGNAKAVGAGEIVGGVLKALLWW